MRVPKYCAICKRLFGYKGSGKGITKPTHGLCKLHESRGYLMIMGDSPIGELIIPVVNPYEIKIYLHLNKVKYF